MSKINVINLLKSNYKNYLPIDIIAFSYASGGAQGEPGGVVILDNTGKFFHFNYATDGFLKDEVYEICPPLKEINQQCKGFNELNMGMGNKLYVHDSIFQKVQEKIKDINSPGALFSSWKRIILEIISV